VHGMHIAWICPANYPDIYICTLLLAGSRHLLASSMEVYGNR